MTAAQKKGSKAPKKAVDLRSEFLALDQNDQQFVTNFFNLHNAAHLMYDLMSDKAKSYVSYCIDLSNNANKIEKKNEV